MSKSHSGTATTKKQRKFVVPMEVEQGELDDLLAMFEPGSGDLLAAALSDDPGEVPEVDERRLAGGFRAKLRFEARPYQQDALNRWLAHDGRGVVVLPTGAGKTVVALMTIEHTRLRTLIVVPTIELLYQWRDTIVGNLGVPAGKVGVVGDGRKEWRSITVITYASAAMPGSLSGGIGLLICDEAHHLPSPAFSSIPFHCDAPYRLGLTATPDRADGRHHSLDLLIGPEVYRRSPADLSDAGFIAQFDEKRLFVSLSGEEQLRYEALMGEWKWFLASKRHLLARGGDFFGDLIRRSAGDPQARRALQAHHQARMIALNAEAKVGVVEQLLDKHCTDKIIVFSEYTALVDTLSSRLSLPSITYRTAPDERKETLDAFRSGAYSKIVTGRVLNEGVDVPDANVGIVVSGSSTTREYIQRLGRVIRPKETRAVLYEIITRRTGEVQTARRRRPE